MNSLTIGLLLALMFTGCKPVQEARGKDKPEVPEKPAPVKLVKKTPRPKAKPDRLVEHETVVPGGYKKQHFSTDPGPNPWDEADETPEAARRQEEAAKIFGPILMDAARKGNTEKVQELIAAGLAYVDFREKKLNTPLHIAVWHGRTEIVRLLIEARADVNAKNKYGTTPLHYAVRAWKNPRNEEVKALIAAEANVNLRDNTGSVPLFYAARNGLNKIVSALIAAGADVNSKNKYGATALHVASSEGRTDTAKALIAAKADINLKNYLGYTPLHYASMGGHIEIVKLLIAAKAALNAKDYAGRTPLQAASYFRHPDIVRLLKAAAAKE